MTRRFWAVLFAVAGVGLLAWWPSLGLGFHADDFEWMWAAREAARSPAPKLPEDVNGHFRPAVELDWLWRYRAFGLSSRAHHACALAGHLVTALLVAWLARRVLRSDLAGLIAGLLFAVSVTARTVPLWASAAPDRLLGLFFAAALVEAWGRGRWPVMSVALLLALLSKETALLAGPMLVVAMPPDRARFRTVWAFAVVSAAAFVPHLMASLLSPYLHGRFAPGPHVGVRLAEAVGALVLPTPQGGFAPGLGRAAVWSGLALVLLVGTLAARTLPLRVVLGFLVAIAISLLLPALSRDVIEPRWLYLPGVLLAPLLAAALLEVRRVTTGILGAWAGNAMLLLAVVGHVMAHGALIRWTCARTSATEELSRRIVVGAASGHPELHDGDVVEVRVPWGSELRFWPVGVRLAVDRDVVVRPIDDRTAPTPGVALLDATRDPARWVRGSHADH